MRVALGVASVEGERCTGLECLRRARRVGRHWSATEGAGCVRGEVIGEGARTAKGSLAWRFLGASGIPTVKEMNSDQSW